MSTHTHAHTRAPKQMLLRVEDTAGLRSVQVSRETYYETKEHCGHWHSRAYAYVYYLHVTGSKSALVCVYAWPMPGMCAHTLCINTSLHLSMVVDTSFHLSMVVSSSDRPRASFVPPGQGSFRKPEVSRTPSASSRTNEEEGGDSDQQ
jgi:hypothetical protein